MAAVRDLRAQGVELEGVTGRPDKAAARELGVKYKDPRHDRMGSGAKLRQKVLFHTKLLQRGEISLEEFKRRIGKLELPGAAPTAPKKEPEVPGVEWRPGEGREARDQLNPELQTKKELSYKRRQALERTQAGRRKAVEEARKLLVVPDGFRSVEHFLDDLRAYCGKAFGLQGELTRYLKADRKSVSRWLAHSSRFYPNQETIDAMAKWYLSHRRGL